MGDLVPVRVGIVDDLPEWEFDAFHDPSFRWNGWLVPSFTRSEAERALTMISALHNDNPVGFLFTTDRQGRDALIIWEDYGDEVVYSDCKVSEDGLFGVYNGWTWWAID